MNKRGQVTTQENNSVQYSRKGLLIGLAIVAVMIIVGLVLFFVFKSTGGMNLKKDVNTGLTTTYKGLNFDEAYLSRSNQKLTNNEVKMGDRAYMYISGTEGFQETNGKVFLGGSILVTDKDGNLMIGSEDIYSEYTSGVSSEDVKSITLALRVGSPMKPGEIYTWKSKVWDKKGTGEINLEVKIKVQENNSQVQQLTTPDSQAVSSETTLGEEVALTGFNVIVPSNLNNEGIDSGILWLREKNKEYQIAISQKPVQISDEIIILLGFAPKNFTDAWASVFEKKGFTNVECHIDTTAQTWFYKENTITAVWICTSYNPSSDNIMRDYYLLKDKNYIFARLYVEGSSISQDISETFENFVKNNVKFL